MLKDKVIKVVNILYNVVPMRAVQPKQAVHPN